MSRSYKHNHICTDRKHGAKYWKRQANRKVRHSFNVPNGKQYRRFYDSWEIHDFVCRESKYDAIIWYNKVTAENHPYRKYWIEDYPTLKDYLNKCWAHDFYRK